MGNDRLSRANEDRRGLIVLLTACVDVGNVFPVARSDPRVRLEDYKRALMLWMHERGASSLVFCENSSHDLSELQLLCDKHNIYKKQVEFLSFYGQDFAPELGKGYGEMRIISHTLANSRLIQDGSLVMKVTGRLFVRNTAALSKGIRKRSDVDIFCDFRGDLSWADARVFCSSLSFLQQYLLPMSGLINDSRGICFETVLGRAAHKAMADGKTWAMLPEAPDLRGVAATANIAIPASLFKRAQRRLFRAIKAAALAR